jgi:hypothetical protein
MADPVIVGYWRKTFNDKDDLPWPVPNELSDEQAKIVYDLIVKKQKSAGETRYRGRSRSRITGESLGCSEYETSEFIWPGDYAKHYVLEHRVKPPDEFLKFLLRK